MAERSALEVLVDRTHWAGRRVFLTGHTGFKGSWLALWLQHLGARVTGYALPAAGQSLFRQAQVADRIEHVEGDIRDLAALEQAMTAADPEVVFHLAAQPLVRQSYDDPLDTWSTNVQGTANVLDACRRMPSLKAVVAITSDKCYQNREWVWPYRESDPMGGHDPYSASKGAAELVIASYRDSFFADGPLVASVRAGNVVGGGDWAKDRLVPDIVRAMLAEERVRIRSPHAVRPWQHVLEALGGYLLIAQHLLDGNTEMAGPWNFGPTESDTRPVGWIARQMVASWGSGGVDIDDAPRPHEATLLSLDCSKARMKLGWRPALQIEDTIERIVAWHKKVHNGAEALQICENEIEEYHRLMNSALTPAGNP